MKKLLALVVATAFTFSAASSFAEDVESVKTETHASEMHKAPVKIYELVYNVLRCCNVFSFDDPIV